jgi:hypothetical protein
MAVTTPTNTFPFSTADSMSFSYSTYNSAAVMEVLPNDDDEMNDGLGVRKGQARDMNHNVMNWGWHGQDNDHSANILPQFYIPRNNCPMEEDQYHLSVLGIGDTNR